MGRCARCSTAEAEVEAAYRTVLRAIERRSFARADLGRRLRRKGHTPEAVETALERAAEQGLLDDAAFAANYVETRSARGRGPARGSPAISWRWVSSEASSTARWPTHDRRPRAVWTCPLALANKRAAQLRDLPRQVRRRRVLAYLARRGFSGREVSEMVGKLLA